MNADFYKIHADEAIQRLNEGNARFVAQECQNIDTSIGRLKAFAEKGQRPYAIVVACADSRVITISSAVSSMRQSTWERA